MRTMLFATIVACCTVFAGAQTVSAPNPPLNVLAESMQDNGTEVQLDGNVRIAACSVVTTDHATWKDSEFELGAHAHMKLTHGIDRLR